MRRPLLLLTGGFVLGEMMILQCRVVLEGILPVLLVICLWTAVCTVSDRSKGWSGRFAVKKGRRLWICLLLFFSCLGMWRAAEVKNRCEHELGVGLDGENAWSEGMVEKWEKKGDWIVADLRDVQVRRGEGQKDEILREGIWHIRKVQVYLDPEMTSLQIGNRIRVWGKYSAFETARNPGEFDFRLYYRSLDMNYRIFALFSEVTDEKVNYMREGLRRVSAWAGDRLDLLAGAEEAGIFRAVLLGQKSTLSEQIRELYQKNGIAHLLAVSGLHLSLASLAVYGLLRKAGAGFQAAGLAGGCVLTGYAVLTGASPSVMRALIMTLCGFLAAYLGRTYDLLSALGLSALYLFWDSPYLLCQAGTQLSYGAVLSIGGLSACFGKESGRRGFFVSASLQLVMLPIVLYHFFQFPLYGVFLNLLVVPLMGIVAGSGAAGVIFSLIHLAAGRFAISGGCVILAWYEQFCKWFEMIPGSSVIMGRPELWQIGAYYALLAVMVLEIRKWSAKNPQSLTLKSYASIFFCILAMFVTLFPIPVRGFEVTFLDVGQGDGICMRISRKTILVDGGSTDQKELGQMRLEPFLKSKGIREIDCAVVSHGDLDHISGLTCLLEECEDIFIRRLILPEAGYGDEAYTRLEELAGARGSEVIWMQRGDEINVESVQINCIWPEVETHEKSGVPQPDRDRNEDSLVLRVDYHSFHMLLTGDMSGEGENQLMKKGDLLSDIQVLKIAHHGSRFSTGGEWLDTVRPLWAVISYGEGNRYAHPHEEVLERLEERGIVRFETARDGAVFLNTDGKEVWWKKFCGTS